MTELQQQLYLLADEMRSMASVGRHFAGNVYEVERAHRIMELAVQLAALAEGSTADSLGPAFAAEPWLRFSPWLGAEAVVQNEQGEILLIQRSDNQLWCLPGGLAEVGRSPAESALRELWEEAGLRGRVERLLAVFNGPSWGSRSKMHGVMMAFQVECDNLMPQPGIEALDARFFAYDAIPELTPGHVQRLPKILALLRTPQAASYFDPADWHAGELPEFQRQT